MDLLDLLRLYGDGVLPLNDKKRVKLVRHKDARFDLNRLFREDYFEEYQARQTTDCFRGASHLVSFIGERHSRSRFRGVYEVEGLRDKVPPHSSSFPYPKMGLGEFFYDLKKAEGFEELEDRLVIDWGAGARSWVQNLKSKRVLELLPEGKERDFPGYQDFVLEHDQLERIVKNPDANRTWHTMLRAVAGIYLIVDTQTGAQYVGSAHGEQGIWGRWATYVRTRHGGNKQLRQLLEGDPDRYRSFCYSVLRTLPRTWTAKEVIEVEQLYKRKLGTRAFGLNSN